MVGHNFSSATKSIKQTKRAVNKQLADLIDGKSGCGFRANFADIQSIAAGGGKDICIYRFSTFANVNQCTITCVGELNKAYNGGMGMCAHCELTMCAPARLCTVVETSLLFNCEEMRKNKD